MPSAVRDAKRSNAKRSTGRARDTCTTHKHNTTVRNTAVHNLHIVGTVFTALCVVHSRAVSSRVPPVLCIGLCLLLSQDVLEGLLFSGKNSLGD